MDFRRWNVIFQFTKGEIFRESLAKVLIKLGERRPSLEARWPKLLTCYVLFPGTPFVHSVAGMAPAVFKAFLLIITLLLQSRWYAGTPHHPCALLGRSASMCCGSCCNMAPQSTWSWSLESRQISLATRCDGHTPRICAVPRCGDGTPWVMQWAHKHPQNVS